MSVADASSRPILVLICVFIAWGGARLWRLLALKHGWVDQPGERRSHLEATPRGGGVGIAVALLVALLASGRGQWLAAAGLAIVAAAGLWDDLRSLSAAKKLLLQMTGVALLAASSPLAPGSLGATAAFLAAFVLALATINAWNFMDGSNGMASLQTLALAAGLLLLAEGRAEIVWLALGLSAACIGFLPENFPRARIFLGDVGSHALGYAVAVLLLSGASSGIDPVVLSLPLSVFAVDTGLTLLWRAAHRQPLWKAHREHLYQLALRAGHGHAAVALAYAAVATGIAFLLPTLENAEPSARLLMVLSIWTGLALAWWIGVRHFRARLGTANE